MDFLTENKRFSFKIGGVNAWETSYKAEQIHKGGKFVTVYRFENGLKVTNIAEKYEDFGAYEWVNYFENTSDKNTEIISELYDCDCLLPAEHEENRRQTAYLPDKNTATKIYSPSGSTWENKEFYCNVDEVRNNGRVNHIYPGVTKHYSASNGRSSEAKAPFFNIHKNGKGYIVAIGWSGQWNCDIGRTNDGITLKTKIEDTHFYLCPGESFRTSSVAILPYTADFSDSQNLWRRFVKDKISPLGKGNRPQFPPVCTMLWGGMKSESMLKTVSALCEKEIGTDCVWLDAGWYGGDTMPTENEHEGDWWAHTGDWTVSPNVHPNGLRDVAKAVHDAGKKFLLWFEPERVEKNVPIAASHPEYFFGNPKAVSFMLNLGDGNAWKYCFDMLSEKIELLEIDWLRIDYNFGPLGFWRNSDEEDRVGISEIKYVNGFYKLWDSLLERFPQLMIDDCASGGRRIDFETLKRSVPLWRSDYQCHANYDVIGAQCHNQSFNTWLPFSGTGVGRGCDEYRVRSAYSSGTAFQTLYSADDMLEGFEEKTAFMKKYAAEAIRVRPYFSEDFYPLTELSENTDAWCANQFNRSSFGDGIVQIFRRENSPYETATFKLRGLEANKKYIFTDADGSSEFTADGEILLNEGLKLTVEKKRTAKIYFYREVSEE